MSVLGWVALGLLLAAVVWLGLALVGAVREIEALRARIDGLAAGIPAPVNARHVELPVGAPAPAWRIASPDGEVVSSSTFDGRRHLVLFADAECRACDDLVPEVVGSASTASIPPVAVVGRGDASSTPSTWRTAGVRVRVGTERGDEISSAFGVDVTPTVVVVDEGGSVVARGAVATLDDVRVLIREAEGVRIVAAGGA
jgi:hypothetical protein